MMHNKRDLEELAQATSSMYQLISSKKTFLIARDAWKDHVQERKKMQLDGEGEARTSSLLCFLCNLSTCSLLTVAAALSYESRITI
jgi:uncharacterized ferredoxin-like protein